MVYFKHIFFKKPPELIEHQISGKRHYETPSGKKLPSVTTVLSLLSDDGIRAWRRRVGEVEANKVMEYAGATGTEMHTIIEEYLDNKLDELGRNPRALKLFNQMKPSLKRINNIIAQEVSLFSEELGVAGRVDCIAEFDGKISVIDFKSSRKKKQKSWIKKYFLQATCYALMFEKLTGKTVDQIVILISADDETVDVFVEDKKDYIEKLKAVIEDYQLRWKFEERK
jgi:genome maintenance exonuclease 1|tara:strand:+ start:154 stop:831 length:678 start_codon:yes stop_codon:yes gene_type:complete